MSSDHLNNSKIRIITNSDIRYEGVLYKINPEEKTITLKNVQSFGTEDRRTDKKQAGSSMLYEYIVFRSAEIKDLIVLKDDTPAEAAPAQKSQAEPKAEPKTDNSAATQTAQPTVKENAPSSKDAPAKPSKAEETSNRNNQQPQRETRKVDDADYDNQPSKREQNNKQTSGSQKGGFQFEKMVDQLKAFEKFKTETGGRYESKYENDNFFDTISSSVASEKKREIENFNDRRIDRDTFGEVPRIHFTSNYGHGRYQGNQQSGGYRGGNNRGGYRNDNYRDSQPQQNQPRDNYGGGRFKRPGQDSRRGRGRDDEEFEYVRKEN